MTALDRRGPGRPRKESIDTAILVIARGVDAGTIRADADIEWMRQMLVSPIMASVLTLTDRVTRAQLALTVDTVLGGLGPRAE